jgi:hypothetical protein
VDPEPGIGGQIRYSKNCQLKKQSYLFIFLVKNATIFPLAPMKKVQTTRDASSHQKRTSIISNQYIYSLLYCSYYFSVQHVVLSLYELIQDSHQGFSSWHIFFSAGAGKVNDFWGKHQHYGNGWLGYKRLWAKPSYLS